MTLRTGRIPLSEGNHVSRRLLARLDMAPHESFMSVVARACAANYFPRPRDLLATAGIDILKPCFLPFTGADHLDAVGTLLSIPSGTLRRAAHLRVEHRGLEGVVDWYGTPLPRRYIDAEKRRFSPQSLRDSPYHRATWMVRPLTFCPSSCQILTSQCPACGVALGWVKTQGVARCEACGRSLCRLRTPKIHWELRDDARAAAALVNTDASMRRAALDRLPEPFRSWQAGDVFVAICELGMVASNLEQPTNSGMAKRFGAGDFSFFKVDDLVAGYRIVRGWPDSVGELAERATDLHAGGTQSIRSVLGILGKFLTKDAAPTAIAELMLEVLPNYVQALRIPLKASRTARICTSRQNGLVTAQEVASQFGICRKRMNRYGDQFESLATSSNRTKGVRLFELDAIAKSVAIARESVPASKVCQILGAYEFLLPSLERVGLIRGVSDADAQLIAGQERIYDSTSLAELAKGLQATGQVASRRATPLSSALEGCFHPMAWASCLRGLRDGALPVIGVDSSSAGFFDNLLVDRGAVQSRVAEFSSTPLPDAVVDVKAGAKLLGTTEVLLRRFIDMGLIPRADGIRQTTMRLGELQDFRLQYILVPEIRRTLGWPPAQTIEWLRKVGVTSIEGDLPIFLRAVVEEIDSNCRRPARDR